MHPFEKRQPAPAHRHPCAPCSALEPSAVPTAQGSHAAGCTVAERSVLSLAHLDAQLPPLGARRTERWAGSERPSPQGESRFSPRGRHAVWGILPTPTPVQAVQHKARDREPGGPSTCGPPRGSSQRHPSRRGSTEARRASAWLQCDRCFRQGASSSQRRGAGSQRLTCHSATSTNSVGAAGLPTPLGLQQGSQTPPARPAPPAASPYTTSGLQPPGPRTG